MPNEIMQNDIIQNEIMQNEILYANHDASVVSCFNCRTEKAAGYVSLSKVQLTT